MDTDPRDTQFAGFAELQYNDLEEMFSDLQHEDLDYGKVQAAIQRIKLYLAQRAYDLVEHVALSTDSTSDYLKMIAGVPDLTEWPEEADAALEHYANHQYDGVDFGDEEDGKDE